MTSIDSPCTKVCTLHSRVPVCTGCGRTLAEIERWPSMSNDQRREAMAGIRARLEKLRENDWQP